MERLTGHAQLQELLGAYALDAVEPDEAAAIERHLLTCPRCRNELADHREVAALLGYAGGTAPSGLWDRIVASLEEPPPALLLTRAPKAADPTAPPFPLPRPVAGDQQAELLELDAITGRGRPQMPPPIHARAGYQPGPAPSSADDKVVPIGRRRPHRTVELRLMLAVATMAAVFVAALGIAIGRLETRSPTQTTNLSALAYRVADADANAKHMTLTSPDGVHTVRAVIIADGTTYLGPGNLDKLPSDETYQMWGIVDGSRISLGVIGDNPTYATFTTPPVANVLAVTVEKRGGVVASTKTPVVTGVVPGA